MAPLHSKDDFAKYKGKLKGKIVLIFDPRELTMHTEPEAHRLTDEEIAARRRPRPRAAALAAVAPEAELRRRSQGSTRRRRFLRQRRPAAFCATRSTPS